MTKKLILLIATILLVANLSFAQDKPTETTKPVAPKETKVPTTADEEKNLAEFITSLEKSGQAVDNAASALTIAKAQHEALLSKRIAFVYYLAAKYKVDPDKIQFSADGKSLVVTEPAKTEPKK